MEHLKTFILCEGDRYQDLLLASEDLKPRMTPESSPDGLDGWSHLMRTADRRFALAYFEWKALRAKLSGMEPNTSYRWTWFNPRTGTWGSTITLAADAQGVLEAPGFPDSTDAAVNDWAARIVTAK